MPSGSVRFDLILIYFVYGLAFFSMGIALLLEMDRTPRFAERRAVAPLALFGLLHGAHEWLEIYVMQMGLVMGGLPGWVAWLRLTMLAMSFVPLAAFGVYSIFNTRPTRRYAWPVLSGWVMLYGLAVGIVGLSQPAFPQLLLDVLARYLLAVPGAALAAFALVRRARLLQLEGRQRVAGWLKNAAWGFGLYSLSQVFVPPSSLGPAAWLNTGLFSELFGFPVQVARGTVGIIITYALLRTLQYIEREREQQLFAAQQARLAALEQVQRELVEREALRQELLRHIVIAQEDERSRIARELHDETAQYLTALSLNLATLHSKLISSPESSSLIDRLQKLAREMSQGLYRLVHDLRPAQLDDLGLSAALQHLADEEGRRSGLRVQVEASGSLQRFDPLVETVLFRVAQEAVGNVVRHAMVDCAQVRLVQKPTEVCLTISDGGRGFDMQETLQPPRGWGLAGMRERAQSVDGVLRIDSAPGKGTLIEISVALPAASSVVQVEKGEHENDPVNVS